jgi:hypothetical protein
MRNSNFRIGSLIILFTSFTSCTKEDLKWDLDKVVRLPKVITISADNIYNTGAVINSEVTEDGGSDVTQRGVCWSTNQNPSITDSITNNGNGLGDFNSIISGLTANTTYHVRAYAINSKGTAYSNEINFKTTNTSASLPTLTTTNASNITTNSASSGGNVTSDGGSNVTQRGICWSTTQNPTLANTSKASGSGMGSFTSAFSGLTSNTSYYLRAYATNSQGTAYGNQISFKTSTISTSLPTVITSSANNITTNSASSGGNVTSDGGSTVTQRGICWSTTQNPTLANTSKASGSGMGSFTSAFSGLTSNTSYYLRAYATNSQGTAYGNQISFKTATPSASLVSSKGCTSLNGTNSLYYGMNGTSATWGLSSSGYSGTCWVAPDPNKSGNLGTVVGSNHYVEFTHNFSSQGYIEFWVNTYNPGYNNLIPSITVNGSAIGSATKIGGQTSSFYWMQVRSPLISAGNNKVRIVLSGSYYVLKIDEIKIYEY